MRVSFLLPPAIFNMNNNFFTENIHLHDKHKNNNIKNEENIYQNKEIIQNYEKKYFKLYLFKNENKFI